MTISERGIALIRTFESFRPKAYPDPGTGGEPITIGWGSTFYEDGAKVKMGDVISKEKGDWLLRLEASNRSKLVTQLVTSTINQNQFDSLSSMCYNTKPKAFAASTLIKKVNKNPNDPTIADEFMKWINKGTPVEKGLTRRRKAEVALYYTPI